MECKITENAKNGLYDDDPYFPVKMCMGDCDHCPHLIKEVKKVK